MKALIKNEEAQAGVGTLIIFIAMVLVAAVAAAVLIQTSGTMQSKSTTTTREAAATIGENIAVEAVDGVSNASSLIGVNITIRLASGGSDIDLSKLLLKVKTQNYNYTNGNATTTTFKVYVLRDPENGTGASINSYTAATNPLLKSGALARLDADVSALSALTSRKDVAVALTPEKGTTFNLPLTLPAISSSSNAVAIYP